jgi:hypothetical protein
MKRATTTRRTLSRLALAGVLPLVAMAAACSEDDGGSVRQIDGPEGGSGSGTGSGSGSAAASGSGVAQPVCEPVGDATAADSIVAVALDEWTVVPETSSIGAGAVNFVADNVGEEPHELVVVRGDSIADLPRTDDGGLDEAALGDDVLGEIEPFPAGEDCNGVFDMTPGSYVLLCAIVETESDGTVESHLSEGMATVVTVG